jgi:signal transduction histidine kinase
LEEALALLRAEPFEIVLLDLGLPDADGTEALTRVSSCSPAVPIVVLSALNDLEVAIESMRLGAQEYLVKGQSEHLLLPRAIRYAIERKRLQGLAAAARAEAERANAVKDEFLAMLGHELRNPLAPIVTGLALMRSSGGRDFDRQLTVVERQVQHVVRLVDDLLDVARIAQGKMELQSVEVDLADIVDDGLETSRPLLESRRHSLTVQVPRGALTVFGDRFRLAQVVSNLLTNAAKYSDPGGEIWIVGRAIGDQVELSVKDKGVGMTPDLLGRVFDLFEQGARSLDRSAGGLGLGLAIVKNLVSLHGGSVAAGSDGPGLGSEFVVRLPRSTGAEAPQSRPSRLPPRVPRRYRRVLIVDDNVDGGEMLELALNMLGHETRFCSDGASALRVAQEFLPEFGLIDIGLPVMDGYELARRLRAEFNQPLTLIAVTGYGQESDRAQSRAAGFDHHLVKPVDLGQLGELLSAEK